MKHKNIPNKTFGKRKETLEPKISKEIERNGKQFGTAANWSLKRIKLKVIKKKCKKIKSYKNRTLNFWLGHLRKKL